MSITSYLSTLPLKNIVPYNGIPPKGAITFTGIPRQNPADKKKIILVQELSGEKPVVTEFKLDDILYMEEIPQAVTESGEGVPKIKIWVRKRAIGLLLEPFEVDNPVHFIGITQEAEKRLLKAQGNG
ncbi:MAG: hypothetical protein LBV68_04870 [Spirochaetaceae bacterium]|jgi:hypothetical protein|nr:hypothetical protein [Spirochaetaceae bacterium]